MRILIIDDDEDLRTLLAHYIAQQWPDAEIEQYDPLDARHARRLVPARRATTW